MRIRLSELKRIIAEEVSDIISEATEKEIATVLKSIRKKAKNFDGSSDEKVFRSVIKHLEKGDVRKASNAAERATSHAKAKFDDVFKIAGYQRM